LVSLGILTTIKNRHRRGYYYLLPHKVKGESWTVSIAKQVASLPPEVHEYKSLKQFLADEKAKPRFTERELRLVKADMRRWVTEERDAALATY